jgi:hypothetical protein
MRNPEGFRYCRNLSDSKGGEMRFFRCHSERSEESDTRVILNEVKDLMSSFATLRTGFSRLGKDRDSFRMTTVRVQCDEY